MLEIKNILLFVNIMKSKFEGGLTRMHEISSKYF